MRSSTLTGVPSGDLIFAVAIERMMRLGRADGPVAVRAVAAMARGASQEAIGAGSAQGLADGRRASGKPASWPMIWKKSPEGDSAIFAR